jgi:hypothetical protein
VPCLATDGKAEKEFIFWHLTEYANGQISMGRMLKWQKLVESRANGPALARACFSPLALDSVNFTL